LSSESRTKRLFVRSHLERERKRKREKKKEREKERGRTREIDREREREGVRVKEAHILIDFERLYLSAGVSWRSINSIKTSRCPYRAFGRHLRVQ
jgi:hypothetical protein